MSASEELNKIRLYINDPQRLTDDIFQDSLDFLGSLIEQTIKDEEIRSKYSQNNHIWNSLLCTLDTRNDWSSEDEEALIKCSRLFRGILLLIRNMIMERNQDSSALLQIISSLYNFEITFPKQNPLYEKTITVFLQILANSQYLVSESESEHLIVQLDQALERLTDTQYSNPIIFILHKFFKSEKEETNHNINLYILLRMKTESSIMAILPQIFQGINFEAQLSLPHQVLINLILDIITHESFENWLLGSEPSASFRWLQIGQLLITSRLDWNNYQLVALMSWSHSIFKLYSKHAIEELRLGIQDTNSKTEDILIIVLDIISDMCQYNEVLQFMKHYDIIEPLITLLGCIHKHVKPLTIKDREKLITPIQQRFPHTKSLIIEIISYMAHDSFDIQEKVRILHGLELVLSNCIIDENNPFVKERSVMCLKFLLKNNAGNQKFVAELEAQKAHDDSALREAGYEVQITDGNINVKKASID